MDGECRALGMCPRISRKTPEGRKRASSIFFSGCVRQPLPFLAYKSQRGQVTEYSGIAIAKDKTHMEVLDSDIALESAPTFMTIFSRTLFGINWTSSTTQVHASTP
jgi:hypothetical protein